MGSGKSETIEDELRDRLRGVRLVLEIGLDDETIDLVRDTVRQITAITNEPESALGTWAPATLVTFLVALGVEHYDGSLWPHLGLHQVDPSRLGRAFEDAIARLKLETFDELGADHGYRYITPILAHGGIPKHSTRDYLGLVIAELRRHPGANADELVALWRSRRTAFVNIDNPVRRFLLYGGGVAVDLLDRTIDLVQTPPASITPALAGVLGLPRHIVEAYATMSAGKASRTSPTSATARVPRPTVRFDPWAGSGPVAELPAVGTRYRGASWRVVGGDRVRMVEASLMEATDVPLDPAATWEIEFADTEGLTRAYAYECLGESPVILFDPASGQYVPDTHPVALDDVWILMPRGTALSATTTDGARVAPKLLAELPTQSGRWAGFVARHIRLAGLRALHARLETIGAERALDATVRIMRAMDRPGLVGPRASGVSGELGETVYSDFPRISIPVIPGFDEGRWTVTLKGTGVAFQGSALELVRDEGTYVLPAPAAELVGLFELTVRGPLGMDLRERFIVVAGIGVSTPARVLLPDDHVPRTADFQACDGVLVDGLPVHGGRALPIPREGAELRVAVSAGEVSVPLRVALPRLQWGLRQRDAVPALHATRLNIGRADLQAGTAEALVVATHRPGTPLALELWADEGRRQTSPIVTSSPHDGRWVFDLSEFRATVAAESGPRLRLRLQVGPDSVVVADLTADVGATDFVATPTGEDTATRGTLIEFTQARLLRSRVARFWSLDRPWAGPIELPIADDAPARVVASASEVPAGRYRIEIAVDDGWASVRRPRRGAPSTAEVQIGTSADVADRVRMLHRDDPSDAVELALHSVGRILPESPLPSTVIEMALDGALANLADEREGKADATTALMARIAFMDARFLAAAIADRFAADRANQAMLLRLLLLALHGRPRLHPVEVDARSMRALWQACPPLAALLDIPLARIGGGEPDDRCDQYLGWRTGSLVAARRGLSQVEIGLPSSQLRALRVGLALMPREHMSADSWVLASIEWLLVQHETGEVADWWRRHGWLASSDVGVSAHLKQAIQGRAPAHHPDKWAAFPQATLAAAIHVVRGDADRGPAADALAWALRLGAERLVVHDLCVARALVLAEDEALDAKGPTVDPEDDVVASGTMVHGTVIHHAQAGSFIDVGLGVDAFLPDSELPPDQRPSPPSVGSSVDAMVVSAEPGTGKLRLSMRALAARDDITGLVFGDRVVGAVVAHSPGGSIIDLGYADAFLSDADSPASLGGRPAIGSSIEVFVLAADPDRGSVRVTRRDLGAEREVLSGLAEGQRVHGPVVEATDIGVFVDLGGVVGLVYDNHIPRDAHGEPLIEFVPGQDVVAEVLHVRAARGQIGLSMRYLERDRFDAATASVRVGDIVEVTVVGSMPYGVFVSVLGVRGLVHRKELSWDRSVGVDDFPIGTVARAVVLDVDPDKRRLSLSFRRLDDDPWVSAVDGLNVGARVEGTVTAITNFGTFVQLRRLLDGLIHISEFPAEPEDGEDPQAFMGRDATVGSAIHMRILGVDADAHRISLTLREPHPWLDRVGLPGIGDEVDGTASKATKHGLFVALPDRLLGLMPPDALGLALDLGEEDVAEAAALVLPIGSSVRLRVRELDVEARVVRLGPIAEDG